MDYKISVEETGEIKRDITIEIPRDVFSQRYDKALLKTASQARLKGFRPGRAPKAIIDKLYGEKIHGDVLNELVSKAFDEAVSENSFNVVGYPEINVEDKDLEKDLKVTAGIELFPNPEVTDYFGVEAKAEVMSADEKELEQRLVKLQEQFAQSTPVEGRDLVEKDDQVVIDYDATVDGEAFQGSSGTDATVEIGAGTSIEGMEEALVGAKLGEEREVLVTLPENAGELAGKEALYKITIKKIQTKVFPELDDELAKKSGFAEDLEGLKTHLNEQIENEVSRHNERAREDAVFHALIEKNQFEIPVGLIDREIRNVLFEMGLLDPRQEDSFRFNVEGFRETLGESAGFRVRKGIMLRKIIEAEGMEFEEKDVDGWLDEVAEKEGKDREEINKLYGFPKNISQLKEMMASRKMIDALLEKAVITEEPKKEKEGD